MIGNTLSPLSNVWIGTGSSHYDASNNDEEEEYNDGDEEEEDDDDQENPALTEMTRSLLPWP